MHLKHQIQQILNNKTKPPGSLGLLEDIALQCGLILQTTSPAVSNPNVVVFAGDHGIAASGLVNPYPQAVTAQMVRNFMQGGAAINVLCRLHDISLQVVDSGVNGNFNDDKNIIDAKIDNGTSNYLDGKAMTTDQYNQALLAGRTIVKAIASNGCNTIGLGEMGIGNSSSAALIMHNLLQLPLSECVGKGTGVNENQYQTKLQTLTEASAVHQLSYEPLETMELLCRIGGFEIVMMTGAYLEALKQRMIIVVDGFISTAAWLCAFYLNHHVKAASIFSHCSDEKGHQKMLERIGVKPLLQLGMRLGEGTGAAMAIPVIRSAVSILNEMASFESASIANKTAV